MGEPSALEAKDRIGYLPEERGVYRKMKVAAYLTFIARLKGVPERGLRERVYAAIERIGFAGRREQALRGALEGHVAEDPDSSPRSSMSPTS